MLRSDTGDLYAGLDSLNKKAVIQFENEPIADKLDTGNKTLGSFKLGIDSIYVTRGDIFIKANLDYPGKFDAQVDLNFSISIHNSTIYGNNDVEIINITVPFFVRDIYNF